MKIMIRSDIEGASGVTTYEQAEKSEFGRRMLMSDLNAAIEGLLAGGAQWIVIYDEHTDGRNVDLADLHEKVDVICGKPPYRSDWGGIDGSFSAMVMVGFHARSGVAGALLPHTYSRKNLSLRVNGVELGEIGMEAAIAGDVGVPLWLVTGDSAGMTEAQAIVPGVRTVTVKEAMGETAALCHAPRRTAKWIYEAARDVAQSPPQPVKPLRFEPPIVMELDLATSAYRDQFVKAYSDSINGHGTVTLRGQSVTEVWSRYLKMKAQV